MQMVQTVLPYGRALSLSAEIATLFGGLVSMTRGGEFNARWGNRLMRARVVAQGAALGLIALWFVLTRLV